MTDRTKMDELTEEMAEHVCDNLCKYPAQCGSRVELEGICAECKLGEFICGILNTHNRVKN